MSLFPRPIALGVDLLWQGIREGKPLSMRLPASFVNKWVQAQGGQPVRKLRYAWEGKEIHYLHTGMPHQPLLILIHGTPGSGSTYLDYLADPILSHTFQMVAVDRPGMGYSTYGQPTRQLAHQAQALLPLLDLHPAPRVFALGHSYGGPVAARLAMEAPEAIDELFLIASPVDPDTERPGAWRAWIGSSLGKWLTPTSLWVCNEEMRYLATGLEEMMPYWAGIQARITVFQGGKDRLVSPQNLSFLAHSLSQTSPFISHTYPMAGHDILWSHQQQIVEALRTLASP